MPSSKASKSPTSFDLTSNPLTPGPAPSSLTMAIMGAVLALLIILASAIGILSLKPLPPDRPLQESSVLVK